MINKEVIGRESEPVINRIEADSVRRFVDAIGIPYKGEVPPTFVITLKGGIIPGLKMPESGLIHVGQKFTYYQRIAIGDVVLCTQRITDIFERRDGLGHKTLIVQEMAGRDLVGDLVFTATLTLIAREEGKDGFTE